MAKKLWGGRFKKTQDKTFWKFQTSISYDKELAPYDVKGSIAHVKMLKKCGIIPEKTARSILTALNSVLKSIESGTFKIEAGSEDIHTSIYNALSKKIGKNADYLHTARSRNDQVVLDLKMYCKDKTALLIELVKGLQEGLVIFAKNNIDVIMPGLTHTQHAVPVLISHHILAYVSMLDRDAARLTQAGIRADEMPLGSCALAGTPFKIDRRYVASLLGFSKISENSIDAVSDRDFVIETLSAIAIIFMHISRLCEDLILFSAPEFDLIDIGEGFCTGSSIMPHKKNPDSLELLRGSCGKAYANLTSVMVMMKGIPMSYNRDMQLDKEPLFDSVKLTEEALTILVKLIKTTKVKKGQAKERLADDSLFALDIADYLAQKGMAFSKAHEIVGKIVSHALDKNIKISGMSLVEFKGFAPEFASDLFEIFDAKKSVMSKRSIGSTNPILVRQQIDKWLKRLQ